MSDVNKKVTCEIQYQTCEKSKKKKKDKKKKSKKHKRKRHSSSSSELSSDEWVEKVTHDKSPPVPSKIIHERDDWMSGSSFLIPTVSKSKLSNSKDSQQVKSIDSYNPSLSSRELNPYWKNNGDGLPSMNRSSEFKKPTNEIMARSNSSSSSSKSKYTSGWKKKSVETKSQHIDSISEPCEPSVVNISNKEINDLAAKLIKAEILGNTKLVAELKSRLALANANRLNNPEQKTDESVMLITTNSKGFSRPIDRVSDSSDTQQRYKKRKLETHSNAERVRYFGDDDKYSLKDMFEHEKYNTTDDMDADFAELGKAAKNPNDDLDDIFADQIRQSSSDQKTDAKNRDRAIKEDKYIAKTLSRCRRCVDSSKSVSQLIISMGETVYLSLPHYESLTAGHCFIAPIRHAPCATQLDENVWNELEVFRKAICRMFSSNKLDTIFFESAINLKGYPHMVLECVPVPEDVGSMGPMYFKKAINECEKEWSDNKKLVDLKGRDVRRAIPVGLPYFSVGFNAAPGFAHVIEDRKDFPHNFAQEIIGGMLDLHHSAWRKPRRQDVDQLHKKSMEFKNMWKNFDCTK